MAYPAGIRLDEEVRNMMMVVEEDEEEEDKEEEEEEEEDRSLPVVVLQDMVASLHQLQQHQKQLW